MSTLLLRQRLIAIAAHEVGVTEIPKNSNTGRQIIEYQRSTTLDGTGWPYCAAFVCWCIREWLKDSEVRTALKLTNVKAAERWRPKTAAAFGFHDWAESRGLLVMNDSPHHVLHTADLITLDVSHIGIVTDDFFKPDGTSHVISIEGNTSPQSSNNEGGGVYQRTRPRALACKFIRMLP
jgi:hypothetical protein